MEIVLEVPEKDVARVLDLVKGIKRVKIKSPKSAATAAKEQLLAELAEAVTEVNKITGGQVPMPTQTLTDLLDELEAEAMLEKNSEQA